MTGHHPAPFRLAIVGSRYWPGELTALVLSEVDAALAALGGRQQLVIVTGDALGADQAARLAAYARGVPLRVFCASRRSPRMLAAEHVHGAPPAEYTVCSDWNEDGKAAGPRRNRVLVKASDAVVAFHHNGSPGTRSTLGMARAFHKPTKTVSSDNPAPHYTGDWTLGVR